MEEIFKVFFENLNFPMFLSNLERKYIYANKEFAMLYNKNLDEIIGATLKDVVNKDMIYLCEEHIDEVLEKGIVVTKEVFSSKGYRQCSIVPIKDKQDNIVAYGGLIGAFTSDGKIKEMNQTMKMQKVLMEKIIDILPGVIFYKDINRKYVYANKQCRDDYEKNGFTNIYGLTDEEINPSKEQAEYFKQVDELIIETKQPIYNEVLIKGWNIPDTWREVVKVPLTDQFGNVTGIVGRSLDITDRKKVNERLEYLSYTDILTGIKNRAYFEVRQMELSKKEYHPLGVIMGDANGLKIINDTFGHMEGDNLLITLAKILNNVVENRGEVFRFGGDEFVILVPNTSLKECEEICNEIVNRCKEEKESQYNISIALGASIRDNYIKDIYDVLKEAEDKAYRKKLLQNSSVKNTIINSLKITLGENSGETEDHNGKIIELAARLGEALNLSSSQIDELRLAADLHDIGKIGIPFNLLTKRDKLTDDEFDIVKTHTEKGFRIINASSELKSVANIVLYHHENWDGTGYPMGLKGEGIPLLSRILSICDSFAVMTNNKIYKGSMSKEEAIEELKRCSGTQFDPKIVEVFVDCVSNMVLCTS